MHPWDDDLQPFLQLLRTVIIGESMVQYQWYSGGLVLAKAPAWSQCFTLLM